MDIFKKISFFGGVFVACLILFQNCTNGFSLMALEQANNLGSLPEKKFSSNSSSGGSAAGYTFSSNYTGSIQDPSGVRVCEYPSGVNCITDADGKSKGRALLYETGLNPSAQVHRLSFDFFSNGYFAKNRGTAHFAIGLRGDITNDRNGVPVSVNGRGFIIGQLGSDTRNGGNPACSRDMSQVETYHGDAAMIDNSIYPNHIFPQSCSDAIFVDNRWYHLELYVSSDRKIGYKVYDNFGQLLYSYLMQDPTNYLNPNLTKWFMGHVFDTPVTNPNGNWSITVNNIAVGQSADAIENNFLEPLMSFYLSGTKLAENSLISSTSLVGDALSIGVFPDLRYRVFGCANPVTKVEGGACSTADQFREISMAGDPAFRKEGPYLRTIEASTRPYPPDIYKVILRVNPQSSYKQTEVRIIKTQ